MALISLHRDGRTGFSAVKTVCQRSTFETDAFLHG
ncbi:hypothetical protein predicted by Glimmer/Critica [Acetobacter senegalensis]|uniref:Uncharacterized protein n=1 Tax=Acetobacter senegalensis TaxID=446692 RepID=A0A0U5B7P0_9PROT|nr:hypothetical protein predicted by Glimmer/Critica [Acetobacter senegalensis]